jgi:hypothetical protein
MLFCVYRKRKENIMKKTAIISLLTVLALTSCGKTDNKDNTGSDTKTTTAAETTTENTAENTTVHEDNTDSENTQTSAAAVTEPPVTTADPGYVSAGGIMDMYPAIYQGIVEAKFYEVAKQNGGLVNVNYAFRDLDANGIPELLLKYGTCEADFSIDVIGLDEEGEEKKICEFGGSHTSFAYDENTGDLAIVWGHMGAASIDYYAWENGGLVQKDHYNFEINEENPSYEKVLEEKGIRFIDFGSAYQSDNESGVKSYLCHPDGTCEDREGIFIYDLV